jgi:hypothetical protein
VFSSYISQNLYFGLASNLAQLQVIPSYILDSQSRHFLIMFKFCGENQINGKRVAQNNQG